jgi:hypothetical protein
MDQVVPRVLKVFYQCPSLNIFANCILIIIADYSWCPAWLFVGDQVECLDLHGIVYHSVVYARGFTSETRDKISAECLLIHFLGWHHCGADELHFIDDTAMQSKATLAPLYTSLLTRLHLGPQVHDKIVCDATGKVKTILNIKHHVDTVLGARELVSFNDTVSSMPIALWNALVSVTKVTDVTEVTSACASFCNHLYGEKPYNGLTLIQVCGYTRIISFNYYDTHLNFNVPLLLPPLPAPFPKNTWKLPSHIKEPPFIDLS